MWGIIATWSFSLDGSRAARDTFADGGSALDALLKLGTTVEDDPSIDSVGYGGKPNADGVMELDAGIMDGASLDVGAVAGIRGFRNPILIANDVRRLSPHNLLVAEGAERFAREHGYVEQEMLTETSRELYRQHMAQDNPKPQGHDTVGIVAVEPGRVWAGASTSGMFFKQPGRVGDSPLPGSGYYADDTTGGAAATGVGEEMMRTALCYRAVELMRQGIKPLQAAETAIRDAQKQIFEHRLRAGSVCLDRKKYNMAIVCMNMVGEYGGAANHNTFAYSIATETEPARVIEVKSCTDDLDEMLK